MKVEHVMWLSQREHFLQGNSTRDVHHILYSITHYHVATRSVPLIQPWLHTLARKACVELVGSHLEIEYLVSGEPHPISPLFILGTSWYDCCEVSQNSPGVSHHNLGPRGARVEQEGDGPCHSEYDWKSYEHHMTLWLQHNLKNLFCGLEMMTVIWCAICVWVKKGERKGDTDAEISIYPPVPRSL